MTEIEIMRWLAGGIVVFMLAAIALGRRYSTASSVCVVIAGVCLIAFGITGW